jgi:hypothetical protein
MELEELKHNRKILGIGTAVLVAALLVFAAFTMTGSTQPETPQDNSPDTDTQPSVNESQNQTDQTETQEESSNDGARFTSMQKDYEVIEVKGVGDQVAVRGSNGTHEFLELGDERVATEQIIPHFTGVEGELYYIVNRNDSRHLFNDGKPVSDGYSTITSLRNIGGEWAMAVQESLMPQYIVRGGEAVGKQYYEAMYPAWVNGELAYKAVKDTDNIIVHGGEEQEFYPEVGYPMEAEGKLTYRAQETNTEFIVHGDERVAENYSSVERVMSSEGQLTYIVNDDGELKLIRNGEDILEDNWQIHPDTTRWVGGNLAYVVTQGDDEYLVWEGEIIGEEYQIPSNPGLIANIDGQVGFAAKQDGDWHVVREGQN